MLMIRAMSLTVLLVNLSTLTTQENVQLSRGAPAFPKNTCDTTCQRRPDDNGVINLLIDKWKHAASRSQKTEVLKIIETKIAQFKVRNPRYTELLKKYLRGANTADILICARSPVYCGIDIGHHLSQSHLSYWYVLSKCSCPVPM